MEATDWRPDGVKILERNGSAASQQERPNPLRRIEWVALGDAYPGLEVKLWSNPPRPLIAPLREQIQKDPEAGTLAMLKLLVLDHRDADGQPWPHPLQDGPLPPTSSDEFWEAIPDEVLQIISLHLEDSRKKMRASVERIFGGSIGTSSAETPESAAGPSGSAGTTS